MVVGIIGCGNIAINAHFPALSKIGNVRVKYACDLIIEKANAMKEKYSFVENVTTDYKEVLADSEVEAVFVLTSNYAHFTVTMDALKAGKHVFCEKPITINYKLSKKMKQEADKQKKILVIGVCNRYHKSVEMIEEMTKSGELGKVYHVYCSFRDCRSIPGLGGAFTTKAKSGGGVLIDWGVHFMDLILYILGGAKIKTVSANAYSEMAKDMKSYKYKAMWSEVTKDLNGTNDVDDFITGFIRTDKASISFNGAWAQNLDKTEMFIDFLGDKKGLRLSYGDHFEIFDGQTLETEKPEYDIPDMYTKEDEAFFESIKTGVKSRANIDYVLETAKLLQALYDSADKKGEVKF